MSRRRSAATVVLLLVAVVVLAATSNAQDTPQTGGAVADRGARVRGVTGQTSTTP